MNSPKQLANYLKEYFVSKLGNNTIKGSLFAGQAGLNIGSSTVPFNNIYANTYNATNLTVTGALTINPTTVSPPIILGTNAQYQEVIGFRAAQVGEYVAGLGLVWINGSLSIGVANTGASGLSIEEHAIRLSSSSDVGTSPSSQVLSSTSSGGLKLATLITTGVIQGAINTNTAHQFGYLMVGNVATSGSAGIAHASYTGTTLAMLQQQSTGDVFLNAPTGNFVFHRINGNTVMQMDSARLNPGGSIAKDLGDYNRKWKTLFAAELYVETLVAQEVMATIGGRIMVTPTTYLVANCASGDSTIDVKHNNLANGMYIYMSSAPGGIAQIEAMKVTSTYTSIPGGYFRYSVNRGEGATSARDWVSGDALVSLGTSVGQGYIELTSTYTVHNHLGPNITIYSRTSTANWDDVKPVVSMGNLRSFVDYSSDIMGFAHGNDLLLTPSTGFKGMTSDNANGLRLFSVDFKTYNGSVNTLQISPTGDIKAGTNIASGATTTLDFVASTGAVRIGPGSGKPSLYWNGTSLDILNSLGQAVISLDGSGNSNFTRVMSFGSSGEIRQGTGTVGTNFTGLRIWRSGSFGVIGGYNNDIQQWYTDSNGRLQLGPDTGAPNIRWNGVNLSIKNSAGNTVIYFDSSGKSYFSNIMEIDVGGEIRQGSGTIGTNFTGLRIWRDGGIGRIGGYNTDILQWYADTDGMLKAGAGTTMISKWGLDIQAYSGTEPNPTENIRSIGFWGNMADIGSNTISPVGRIWGGVALGGGTQYGLQFEVFHPTETADYPKMFLNWDSTGFGRQFAIIDVDTISLMATNILTGGNFEHFGTIRVTGSTSGFTLHERAFNRASIRSYSPVASEFHLYDVPNTRDIMTTDGSGNIIFPYSGTQMLIGASAGSGARLEIYQPGTTSAIPTLSLTQADLSEEFIQFRGTVATGNPINTDALGSYYGRVRVSINGTMKWIAIYN